MKLIATVFALALVAIVFAAIIAPFAWLLMILLGALASATGWACAIGFVPCFIITLIIGIFL